MKTKKVKTRWSWKKRLLIIFSSFFCLLLILSIVFRGLTLRLVFALGYQEVHKGNNERGNKLMQFAVSSLRNPDGRLYHALSVQNTKNGNYDIATAALNKAIALQPENHGYYGWVLLYYYHDYSNALVHLEKCDALTPNFSDVAGGEDIHYLKGLAKMQLKQYQNAIDEFNIYIKERTAAKSEDWVDLYTFFYKARCLGYLGQSQEALLNYDKAIKYYPECTEAYYYKGLELIKLKDSKAACENFEKALTFIQKGYKKQDMYVEMFDEIYKQDIEKTLMQHCR